MMQIKDLFRSVLGATGSTYYYDYYFAYIEDSSISKYVNKYVGQMIDYIMNNPMRDTKCFPKEVWYFVTSDLCDVLCSTNDWKFAINHHRIGIRALVCQYGVFFNVEFKVYAYDRYQFDVGQKFMGIPDEWNGNFVTYGWAKSFTSIGKMDGIASMAAGDKGSVRIRLS